MMFGLEKYSGGLIAEMVPLWKEHYQEIAAFKDIPLDPDIGVYERCAESGILRIFSARQIGKLVGYAVFIVKPNPHYRDSVQAVQDILYLNPSVRKGLTGYKFIKWCDEKLKQEGVQVVYQHVKHSNDFRPVLEKIGYKLHDYVMSRRLN